MKKIAFLIKRCMAFGNLSQVTQLTLPDPLPQEDLSLLLGLGKAEMAVLGAAVAQTLALQPDNFNKFFENLEENGQKSWFCTGVHINLWKMMGSLNPETKKQLLHVVMWYSFLPWSAEEIDELNKMRREMFVQYAKQRAQQTRVRSALCLAAAVSQITGTQLDAVLLDVALVRQTIATQPVAVLKLSQRSDLVDIEPFGTAPDSRLWLARIQQTKMIIHEARVCFAPEIIEVLRYVSPDTLTALYKEAPEAETLWDFAEIGPLERVKICLSQQLKHGLVSYYYIDRLDTIVKSAEAVPGLAETLLAYLPIVDETTLPSQLAIRFAISHGVTSPAMWEIHQSKIAQLCTSLAIARIEFVKTLAQLPINQLFSSPQYIGLLNDMPALDPPVSIDQLTEKVAAQIQSDDRIQQQAQYLGAMRRVAGLSVRRVLELLCSAVQLRQLVRLLSKTVAHDSKLTEPGNKLSLLELIIAELKVVDAPRERVVKILQMAKAAILDPGLWEGACKLFQAYATGVSSLGAGKMVSHEMQCERTREIKTLLEEELSELPLSELRPLFFTEANKLCLAELVPERLLLDALNTVESFSEFKALIARMVAPIDPSKLDELHRTWYYCSRDQPVPANSKLLLSHIKRPTIDLAEVNYIKVRGAIQGISFTFADLGQNEINATAEGFNLSIKQQTVSIQVGKHQWSIKTCRAACKSNTFCLFTSLDNGAFPGVSIIINCSAAIIRVKQLHDGIKDLVISGNGSLSKLQICQGQKVHAGEAICRGPCYENLECVALPQDMQGGKIITNSVAIIDFYRQKRGMLLEIPLSEKELCGIDPFVVNAPLNPEGAAVVNAEALIQALSFQDVSLDCVRVLDNQFENGQIQLRLRAQDAYYLNDVRMPSFPQGYVESEVLGQGAWGFLSQLQAVDVGAILARKEALELEDLLILNKSQGEMSPALEENILACLTDKKENKSDVLKQLYPLLMRMKPTEKVLGFRFAVNVLNGKWCQCLAELRAAVTAADRQKLEEIYSMAMQLIYLQTQGILLFGKVKVPIEFIVKRATTFVQMMKLEWFATVLQLFPAVPATADSQCAMLLLLQCVDVFLRFNAEDQAVRPGSVLFKQLASFVSERIKAAEIPAEYTTFCLNAYNILAVNEPVWQSLDTPVRVFILFQQPINWACSAIYLHQARQLRDVHRERHQTLMAYMLQKITLVKSQLMELKPLKWLPVEQLDVSAQVQDAQRLLQDCITSSLLERDQTFWKARELVVCNPKRLQCSLLSQLLSVYQDVQENKFLEAYFKLAKQFMVESDDTQTALQIVLFVAKLQGVDFAQKVLNRIVFEYLDASYNDCTLDEEPLFNARDKRFVKDYADALLHETISGVIRCLISNVRCTVAQGFALRLLYRHLASDKKQEYVVAQFLRLFTVAVVCAPTSAFMLDLLMFIQLSKLHQLVFKAPSSLKAPVLEALKLINNSQPTDTVDDTAFGSDARPVSCAGNQAQIVLYLVRLLLQTFQDDDDVARIRAHVQVQEYQHAERSLHIQCQPQKDGEIQKIARLLSNSFASAFAPPRSASPAQQFEAVQELMIFEKMRSEAEMVFLRKWREENGLFNE